jgi:hypothetical protein
MARARLLKPGFFKNEELARLSYLHRLTFEGLWTLADRMGRVEDRPGRIKAELFPYENIDIDPILTGLASAGFIIRYVAQQRGRTFRVLGIPTFLQHQSPHHREPESLLPAPPTEKPEASPRLAQGKPQSSRTVSVTGDPVTGDPVTGDQKKGGSDLVTGDPVPPLPPSGASPPTGGEPPRVSRTTKQNIADAKRLIARRLGKKR